MPCVGRTLCTEMFGSLLLAVVSEGVVRTEVKGGADYEASAVVWREMSVTDSSSDCVCR